MNDVPAIVHVARDESRFKIGIKNIAISHKNFTDVTVRGIDARECMPCASSDTDWGEQDSLANIPRRRVDPQIRALTDDGERGDV